MGHALKVASGVCWNLEQLMAEVERYDRHNEMVKLEVNHGFEPGRKCYHWTLLYMEMPPQNECDDACDEGHTYVPRRCVLAAH
jgi:hypothetical protein